MIVLFFILFFLGTFDVVEGSDSLSSSSSFEVIGNEKSSRSLKEASSLGQDLQQKALKGRGELSSSFDYGKYCLEESDPVLEPVFTI